MIDGLIHDLPVFMDIRRTLRRKFELLAPSMGERARRLWAGTEADAIGYGGVKAVADATKLAIRTVRKGRDEVRAGASAVDVVRERRRGAGAKRLETKNPGLVAALEALVSPETRGHPESLLRWTSKSLVRLSAELTKQGHPVSARKVSGLLSSLGFSLQGNSRVNEASKHEDRDEQFQFIARRSADFLSRDLPVISVDTKKKELIGEHANRGREWEPKGRPVRVMTYDFPDLTTPKAIPYGVYDVANNKGFVNVGTDHDTPTFAVHSIERWWELMGRPCYPNARELFITADAGGSNGRRVRMWKSQLQTMADKHNIAISVSHYPPGTSKWNRIEHRLFSFISFNWRGRPLVTYETVVALIAATTTSKGLTVSAELDNARYPVGISVNAEEFKTLHLDRDAFHGEWNYTLRPRTPEQLQAAAAPPAKSVPVTHAMRAARWMVSFEQQRLSGMSARDFCLANKINLDLFKKRRRRLVGLIRAPRAKAK